MNGLAVCESFLERATTMAMISYSESRTRWNNERRQAKANVRHKSCCDAQTRTATEDREHHNRSVNVDIVGESVAEAVVFLLALRLLVLGHLTCTCTVSFCAQENQLRIALPSFHGSGAASSNHDLSI